ncbi:hypothetical protein J5Y09_15970 [Roseomonas sp. PWR1]|uniref:Uncharacterized protein n=1 Tax=Roseomonas nitratireducens TaxID=2820810 RepID=A0ABS4AVM8_9PROT|nr:hypothetical protein [Neoroseomonas nitratireducens]MBP0465424.1 hypothetical protein [Neoroseomonas nitratireducens]
MAPFEKTRRSAGFTGGFASALLGGQFDGLPVQEKPFAATLGVLGADEMVVQDVRASRHLPRWLLRQHDAAEPAWDSATRPPTDVVNGYRWEM